MKMKKIGAVHILCTIHCLHIISILAHNCWFHLVCRIFQSFRIIFSSPDCVHCTRASEVRIVVENEAKIRCYVVQRYHREFRPSDVKGKSDKRTEKSLRPYVVVVVTRGLWKP